MEKLNRIKEKLGLTITQTAELFKVNRKTVYDWLEDVSPGTLVDTRINLMISILECDKFKSMDMRRLKSFWNVPIVDNNSFRDILHNESMNKENIKEILFAKMNEIANCAVVEKNQRKNRIYISLNTMAEHERVADLTPMK